MFNLEREKGRKGEGEADREREREPERNKKHKDKKRNLKKIFTESKLFGRHSSLMNQYQSHIYMNRHQWKKNGTARQI